MSYPWATFTKRSDLMPTALDNLANTVISAASAELDNLANVDTHQIIQVKLDSVTFVASAYLEIYMIQDLDGDGTYEDDPVSGGLDINTRIATIPVKAGTGARVVTSGKSPLLLPPFKVKYFLVNQANVTFNNSTPTNQFNVWTGRMTTT